METRILLVVVLLGAAALFAWLGRKFTITENDAITFQGAAPFLYGLSILNVVIAVAVFFL